MLFMGFISAVAMRLGLLRPTRAVFAEAKNGQWVKRTCSTLLGGNDNALATNLEFLAAHSPITLDLCPILTQLICPVLLLSS